MIEKMAMGLVDQMAEEKMIDKEAEEYYVCLLYTSSTHRIGGVTRYR